MTDIPDRIHAEEPDVFDGAGFWQVTPRADHTEYVRLTIPALAKALREALEDDTDAYLTIIISAWKHPPPDAFVATLRALEEHHD